jgi:hypothetical protein
MKCKVFFNSTKTTEYSINEWLSQNSVNITQMKQSYDEAGYLIVTILYDELKEIRRKKLEKLNDL